MARTTTKKPRRTSPADASKTTARLFAALAQAQAKMPVVGKSQVADRAPEAGGAYAFADLAGVMRAVRGPLAAHGLAIVQRQAAPPRGGYVQLETLLTHESGEWIRGLVTLPVGGKDPKEHGAVMTYGRRYGLMALLGLATEDDDTAALAVEVARRGDAPAPARNEQLQQDLADLEETIRRSESRAELAGLVAKITSIPPGPRAQLRKLYAERVAVFDARPASSAA